MHTSADSTLGFSFRYDIDTIFFCKILQYRYRYFKDIKYVNLVQAPELDVNIEQGSMLHLDNTNVFLGKLIKLFNTTVIKLRHLFKSLHL